jgi:hypothetical protein
VGCQHRTDRKTDWANWELHFHFDAIVVVAVAVVVVATRPAKMSTANQMTRETDWFRNRHRPHLIMSKAQSNKKRKKLKNEKK